MIMKNSLDQNAMHFNFPFMLSFIYTLLTLNREWTWAIDNVLALSKEQNATDAEHFNLRLHDLDWREYWTNTVFAMRTHYFKAQ